MAYWQRVIDLIKRKMHKNVDEPISEIVTENAEEDSTEVEIEEEEESFEKKVSKEIRELMRQKKYEEAKEKCTQFPDNDFIQSQLITILIKENNLEEAEKICEKFSGNLVISSQYKRIKNIQKESDNSKKNEWMNIIKTKLYYDDIDSQFIEKIKQNEVGIDEWRKTLALLAIYDKNKNLKMTEVAIKEAKKIFAEDADKIKILNKMQNGKKSKVFNGDLFFELLHWKFDGKTEQEILNKRNTENKEVENKTKEESQVEKEVVKIPEPVKPIKKEPVNITPVSIKESEKETENSEVKVKTKNRTKKNKEAKAEPTIGEVYSKEVIELKVKILMKCGEVKFDNNKLSIKENEEVFKELKSSYDRQKEFRKEFELLEKVETKPADDLRGKLQLILLLREYEMKDIADNKLKAESEIYDETQEMCKFKRTSAEYASREKKIRDKISKIPGKKKTTYELLDKAREK